MFNILTTLFGLLLLALIALFVLSNSGFVSLSLFPFPYIIDLPLSIGLLLMFCTGAAVGILWQYRRYYLTKSALRQAQKRIDALEDDKKRQKARTQLTKAIT